MRQVIVDDDLKLDAANVIKVLRDEKGLTLRQLSVKADVSKSGLSRWEHGDRVPNVDVFTRILKAMDAEIVVLRKPKRNQEG